jgi:hypothetical protein
LVRLVIVDNGVKTRIAAAQAEPEEFERRVIGWFESHPPPN